MTSEIIITDDNWRDHIGSGGVLPHSDPRSGGDNRRFGCLPRKAAYGSLEFAAPAEQMKLIPQTDWRDRIADQERSKSRLSDVAKDVLKLKVLDQDGLNYCHSYCAVQGVMLVRGLRGLPHVDLSPCFVGGYATGFVNAGASLDAPLRVLSQRGVCELDYVPGHQVSKRNWKPGADENAAKYKVTEWWDLGFGASQLMFQRVVTCLLSGQPVACGFDWWGHAVLLLDVVFVNGQYGIRFLNSWTDRYGDGGYGIVTGQKAIPGQGFAIRDTSFNLSLAA